MSKQGKERSIKTKERWRGSISMMEEKRQDSEAKIKGISAEK